MKIGILLSVREKATRLPGKVIKTIIDVIIVVIISHNFKIS